MRQYLDQLEYILENGTIREDRTGTGTIGVFGIQDRYNLEEGFPATTTKKLFWKGVVYELLWMLKGDTNIKYLVDNGVHIWDDDAFRVNLELCPDYPYDKEKFLVQVKEGTKLYDLENGMPYIAGDLGPIYGAQWRGWIHCCKNEWHRHSYGEHRIDQVYELINNLKNNPFSRRHILSAWNTGELNKMVLPPCHVMSQFYVSNDKRLSCHMYQRSADMFLGAPFNIASYALLTHILAQLCGYKVGDLIHSIGDAHIYMNHIEQAKEQLKRKPHKLPKLELSQDIKELDDFTFGRVKYEDCKLVDYKHHPAIKATLSVGLKKDLCIWCNEREVAFPDSNGCEKCPTIPHECTCNAGDKPHDISCKRSASYSTISIIKEVVEECLSKLEDKIIPRYNILECKQDPDDPNKITVVFEWREI